MSKRRRKQPRRPKEPVETEAYSDDAGNALQLRKGLSPATIAKIGEPPSSDAANIDDAWQRREEMLFERLAVSWEIGGLEPITDQKMLLGRYRMASPDERRWVRDTLRRHVEQWLPGL